MTSVVLLKTFARHLSHGSIMLHVILLESALELVPSEISSLKEIQSYAHSKGKSPTKILLDQSYHGRSMTRLPYSERRGRPDIVYLSLLTLLETPLCKAGNLGIHIHLQDGRMIVVNPEVRLPRNYERFIGLMEQLLIRGQVPPKGDPLLSFSPYDLEEVMNRLEGKSSESVSILALEEGDKKTIKELTLHFPQNAQVPVIVGIGAFPHGEFSKEVERLFDDKIALSSDVMMAWHVCAEVLWAYTWLRELSSDQA